MIVALALIFLCFNEVSFPKNPPKRLAPGSGAIASRYCPFATHISVVGEEIQKVSLIVLRAVFHERPSPLSDISDRT